MDNFVGYPISHDYVISFVDIDETIFHTTAKVKVIKDGRLVVELTNQEFNSYRLNPGESFDYSQFSDADLFQKTSRPIEQMVERVKILIDHIMEDDKENLLIFLTARGNFNNREQFLQEFRKVGIDIDLPEVYVERTGNIPRKTEDGKELSVADKKKIVVLEYILGGQFRRIQLFDDNKENLKEFLSIQREIPPRAIERTRHFHQLDPEIPVAQVIEFRALQVVDDHIRPFPDPDLRGQSAE